MRGRGVPEGGGQNPLGGWTFKPPAWRLRGKLLLGVGQLDDFRWHTLRLVDALIEANKNFELIVFPGMGHEPGGQYFQLRKWAFFRKHLLGIEPPNWNALGVGTSDILKE